MRDKRLLPCPFCGSSIYPKVTMFTPSWPTPSVICVCGGEMTAGTAQEAIAAWNRRAVQRQPYPADTVEPLP